MRLVVSQGTGKKAKTSGYLLGGKTGTAEKLQSGKYSKSAKISSFIGAFPINKPKYAVFIIVDEPKGNKKTFNYATGGWVAAPAVGRIVDRIAPILGITPNLSARFDVPGLENIMKLKDNRQKSYKLLKKVGWNED